MCLCLPQKLLSGSRGSGGSTAAGASAAAGASDAGTSSDVEIVDDSEACNVVRKCKQRSTVWNFFEKTKERNSSGNLLAQCRLCENKTLISTTNTTNMQTHLARIHPEAVFLDPRNGQKVFLASIF